MRSTTARLLNKRIFSSVIILFLIITFLFFLVRISPGDPVQKFVNPTLSPKLAEQVRESLNLDKPIHMQYIGFLTSAISGDLGVSYNFRRDVSSVFVTGVFLVFIFSELLNIFPSSGLSSYDSADFSFWARLTDYIYHLILPIITLSLIEIAIFYKYLRDNLEDVYNKLFVLNLRASGVSEKDILLKHVIPNAINPLITIAGIELGIMLGGTLIVEVVFGLPGMGRLIIEAIFQ